jgi:hypothetical protein
VLVLAASFAMVCAAADNSAWVATDIRVDQTIKGEAGHIATRLEVGTLNDARMSIDIDFNGSQKKGTIILIGGRWMLTQGFTPDPGFEIDVLDQVALNSQLIIGVLNAALPNGPPAGRTGIRVKHSDTSEPIRVGTASASAQFGPPWSVDGTVEVASVGAPAVYHLTLTFSNAGRATTTVLNGSLANPGTALSIPDSMPLKGWKVYRVGPYPQPSPGGGTKSDYGARPANPQASTVGELRQLGDKL